MKTFDLATKDLVRRAICRKSASKALPYKSILMMPSHEMLDVKKMIEFRSIKPFNCHITAIERNPEIANKITKKLEDLGFASVEVLNCELYEADLGGRVFDFAYLDTCGKLNEKILNWLAKQVQLKTFAPKARISMAFSTPARCKSRLEEDAAQLVEVLGLESPKLEPEVVGFNSEPIAVLNNHETLGTVLKGLFGEPIQSIAYKNEGHAIPMHVFTFRAREINTGIGKVLTLIESVGGKADQLTPGVKAAMKRMPKLEVKCELVPATLEDLKLTPPKRGRGRPRKIATESSVVQESNSIAPVQTITWNVPKPLSLATLDEVNDLKMAIAALEGRIRLLEKDLDKTICTVGEALPHYGSDNFRSPWD